MAFVVEPLVLELVHHFFIARNLFQTIEQAFAAAAAKKQKQE